MVNWLLRCLDTPREAGAPFGPPPPLSDGEASNALKVERLKRFEASAKRGSSHAQIRKKVKDN